MMGYFKNTNQHSEMKAVNQCGGYGALEGKDGCLYRGNEPAAAYTNRFCGEMLSFDTG